ncbi:bifunctional DNA primase/polymerase [Lactobacillus gallinarum]|uniref:bifunctional DNA primase/polymerase n=1 Tax=Lactobacillus gallinarum TaxID=52242 RepID=UPI000B36B39F|nr:bifunctional DNA primase/polymerase [Lactobacillus gallinarum]OUP97719.1 hypothetical protein B5E95_09590 [Lactobacillus gallinarum]
MNNKMMEAALDYQQRGFYVVPIEPGAKNPAIPFKDKPALSRDKIKELWTKNPNYNIALRTVNHFVIDIDSPAHTGSKEIDGFKSLKTIPRELLLPTYSEWTASGGMHLYYYKPKNFDLHPLQMLDLLPGIDIKAHPNNYALVAPSKKGKGNYTIYKDVPMVIAPYGLIDHLQKIYNQSKGLRATSNYKAPLANSDFVASSWTGKLINEIAQSYEAGNRNNTIAYLTGKLLRAGADPEAILIILQDVNRRFFRTLSSGKRVPAPLTFDEISKTFSSILRSEVSKHDHK